MLHPFPVMCDLYPAGPRVQLHFSHQEPKGEKVVAGLCSGRRCTCVEWLGRTGLKGGKQTTRVPFCLQGYLLYRDTSNHTMSAIKINPETLEPDGTIIMPGEEPAVNVAEKERAEQKKA